MKRDYSPERRASYAAALRAAKDNMWNGDGDGPRPLVGEHKYICQALVKAYLSGQVTKTAALATHAEVLARIQGFVNLEDWLAVTHGIPLQATDIMQGLRFIWIDKMIEEFER